MQKIVSKEAESAMYRKKIELTYCRSIDNKSYQLYWNLLNRDTRCNLIIDTVDTPLQQQQQHTTAKQWLKYLTVSTNTLNGIMAKLRTSNNLPLIIIWCAQQCSKVVHIKRSTHRVCVHIKTWVYWCYGICCSNIYTWPFVAIGLYKSITPNQ